ncbi:MAG TPA: M56 family metallopeptidase [Pyrinomonadaceae bacterium]
MSFPDIASLAATMLFNLFLVGTLISLTVFTTLRLTRNVSPRMRYLFVVISFTAATVVPFFIVLTSTQSEPFSSTIEHTHLENSRVVITGDHYPSFDPMSPAPSASHALSTRISQTADWLSNLLSNPIVSILVFSVWLIGTCLLLSREITGHVGAARARRAWREAGRLMKLRLSWPENIPLYIDNEFGPCALGIIRPRVVIPEHLLDDLDPLTAQQVARHELNHLKWRDPSLNTIMRMTRAFLWPSLPLWYLNRVAGLEREAAADKAAIEAPGVALPDLAALEYASTLISIARKRAGSGSRQRYSFAATEVGHLPGLNDRVRRLMAGPSKPRYANLFMAVVTLIISAGALTVLPVVKVASQKNFQTSRNGPSSQSSNAFGSEVHAVGKNRSSAIRNISMRSEKELSSRSHVNPALLISELGTISATVSAVDQEIASPPVTANISVQDFESQMAAVGYKNLSPTQLADMKANAVGPWYVAEMAASGYTGLPADMLIRFKQLAVNSAYIQEMKSLGYDKLSPGMLVDMKANAVGPPYVAEMAASGYSGLSVDMLLRFKWLAVSSSYIQEMKSLGYEHLSPRTLADFRQQAVSSTFIREMRALVSGSISAEQLVSLRFYGATPQFISQLKALGYETFSAEQLISMRLHGVSVAYIEQVKSRSPRNLSIDDLIGMRMRNNN